jgi:putative transcriptional regulator
MNIFIEVKKLEFKCRLKVILAEKDIKHGDFATRIGMSTSAFSLVVNNRGLPSFEFLYKICEELDMDPREIWIRLKKET